MKRVLKHKKSLLAAIVLLILVVIFYSVRLEKSGENLTPPPSGDAVSGDTQNSPLPALREQQDQLAQKLFTQPRTEKADVVLEAYVKGVLSRYADEHQVNLSDADLTELAAPILQLRGLIQQANDNIANQQDPFSSEDQVRYMTELMSGENGFKQKLGVTLSAFVETLSDEEVQTLFGAVDENSAE
ncbi:MAG TPA: hypothetical protein VFM46_11830 [Pseudomonadales bacterium]|nr:hypothetical protein [Pseudomonadales bacterium]